jgi:hypothetical protein
MLKRLGEWLSAVFVQWRLSWAWIGAIGAAYAMLPNELRPTFMPPTIDSIVGIGSAVILLAGSFVVWKQERDKCDALTDSTHLVLQGLPIAKPHAHNMDFVFTFRNEGQIPLEKSFVAIHMTINGYYIDGTRQDLDYLAASQFYEARFRFSEKPVVLVGLSRREFPLINFRLLVEYERTERHLRCKAEDNVTFDPLTQDFLIASRNKPAKLPLPPSRLRRVWDTLQQLDG